MWQVTKFINFILRIPTNIINCILQILHISVNWLLSRARINDIITKMATFLLGNGAFLWLGCQIFLLKKFTKHLSGTLLICFTASSVSIEILNLPMVLMCNRQLMLEWWNLISKIYLKIKSIIYMKMIGLLIINCIAYLSFPLQMYVMVYPLKH